MVKKRNLLILLAIPAFILYYWWLAKYCDTLFFISDMVCFGVFTVCASLMLSCKNQKVNGVVCALLHIGLIGAAVFLGERIDLIPQRLYVYFLFCVPPLMLLALFLRLQARTGEEQSEEATRSGVTKRLKIFEGIKAAFLIPLLLLFLFGKEKILFKMYIFSISLAVVMAVTVLCYLILYFGDGLPDADSQMFMLMLSLMSIYEFLVYVLWANQYNEDIIFITFPICVPLVVIFKEYSVVKSVLTVISSGIKKGSG